MKNKIPPHVTEAYYETLDIILTRYDRNMVQVLQNEMNLAFSVYNQFAMQVEQAKIELKKESPIFSTLNPIEIPSSKSEPIVWKIVFKYFSIGIIMCLMILIADLTNILPSRK